MAFHTEPEGYSYGCWADLQGAWENLRDVATQAGPFPHADRFFMHLHEGMSWDSVRDLKRMEQALILVRNLAKQAELTLEVQEAVSAVAEALEDVRKALAGGESP